MHFVCQQFESKTKHSLSFSCSAMFAKFPLPWLVVLYYAPNTISLLITHTSFHHNFPRWKKSNERILHREPWRRETGERVRLFASLFITAFCSKCRVTNFECFISIRWTLFAQYRITQCCCTLPAACECANVQFINLNRLLIADGCWYANRRRRQLKMFTEHKTVTHLLSPHTSSQQLNK